MSFDVIIPAHNSAATISEAVQSAASQSLAPREILVVADACEDATAMLARRAGARVIEIAAGSPAAARNAGIARGSAEYLAFLDADDLWQPRWLSHAADAIEQNPSASLFYGGVEEELPSGQRIRRRALDTGEPLERLLCECFLTTSAVVLRRSAFEAAGGFREHLIVAEDYDLWLRLAAHHQFAAVDGVDVVYRRFGGGAMRSPQHFARLEADTAEVVAAALERHGVPLRLRNLAWANVYRMSAERYVAHGLGGLARRPLWTALKHRPASLKLWAIGGLTLLPPSLADSLIGLRRSWRVLRTAAR